MGQGGHNPSWPVKDSYKKMVAERLRPRLNTVIYSLKNIFQWSSWGSESSGPAKLNLQPERRSGNSTQHHVVPPGLAILNKHTFGKTNVAATGWFVARETFGGQGKWRPHQSIRAKATMDTVDATHFLHRINACSAKHFRSFGSRETPLNRNVFNDNDTVSANSPKCVQFESYCQICEGHTNAETEITY